MPINQLEVLTALDRAKLQWYHFTAIVIAGMGFFSDAYDLFCISTVTNLLGRIYYFDEASSSPGILPKPVAVAVMGVALCGALCGELFFGWMGDKIGRKKVFGITLLLMVFASIGSGLSFDRTPKAVITTLCFFRFWLGFGVGGDYPLSATIISEYGNKKNRGAFIAAVFTLQGFGILAGGAVAIFVSAVFNSKYHRPAYIDNRAGSTAPQADHVWRIILMFGAIPAALTYYWRMKMPETARYTALIRRDANQAAADMSSVLNIEIEVDQRRAEEIAMTKPRFSLFSREFARRHGWHLLGTASTWFLVDIVFYSQNLYQKDKFTILGWLPDPKLMNAIEEVQKIAKSQLIVAACSTVPGYFFTIALVDQMGRKRIQLMGFFFMTLFTFAFAISYNSSQKHLMGVKVVLYCSTFFFSNFGPNVTTFIVPAEIFPARLRSTCHGISGAAGKAGAVIGTIVFLYAGKRATAPLLVLAVTSALGVLFTFLIPESMGKSLEEISGENDEEQAIQLGYSQSSTSRTAPSE